MSTLPLVGSILLAALPVGDYSLLASLASLGAFFVSHKNGLVGGRLGNGGAVAVFFVASRFSPSFIRWDI
jgi:hypothetical protein